MISLTIEVVTLVISALTLYLLIVVGLKTQESREEFFQSAPGKLVAKFFPGLV